MLCCAISGVPKTCLGLCTDAIGFTLRSSRSLSQCSLHESTIEQCGQGLNKLIKLFELCIKLITLRKTKTYSIFQLIFQKINLEREWRACGLGLLNNGR